MLHRPPLHLQNPRGAAVCYERRGSVEDSAEENSVDISRLTFSLARSTVYYKEGADFMAFSIRLTDEEKALAESYAKLHSISVAEAFKRALFDQIEDEFDITVAGEAYKEFLADPKTYTHDEVKELLGL